MPQRTRSLVLVACWIGAALRLSALFANHFHADEALFAGWARQIAVWRDPLLLTQAVDKPPLLFYLQAMAYPLFGPVEWAARLPNLIASILLIPLIGVLVWCLFRDSIAVVVSALLTALTPLAIQFSATAFVDPLLTFWLVAALFCVAGSTDKVAGRFVAPSFFAGIFFGLATATKYQAILFLPLLIGFALLNQWGRHNWLRSLAGLFLVAIPLLAWLAIRSAPGELVRLQWSNIGGLRLAWSWELWPRLTAQLQLWRYSLGWPLIVTAVLMIVALIATRRYWLHLFIAYDGLIALFVLAYLILHWFWAVPVWDRYFLPVLPLIILLIGRGVTWLWTACQHLLASRLPPRLIHQAGLLFALILVLIYLPVAMAARAGRYPIGGWPAADDGAARVAAALTDAPYGTVLYDHWYSWHWRYQLFDKRVYVSWFPHTDALLADLAVFGTSDSPRYIALPVSELAKPVVRRLTEAGYRLTDMSDAEHSAAMKIYRIESAGGPGK